MKNYKISIITASYNCANTIEQTIYSVINQSYNNIEYIIIDGGSTDETVEIIKKYDSKISFWCSEKDGGLYNALNKGIKKATGDYIEIIGADDCLCSKNVIQHVVEQLHDKIDIFSGCVYVVHENCLRQSLFSNSHAKNRCNYNGGMIPHAGMFVRRDVFKKYQFDEKYHIASDYKFFLQCYFDDGIKFYFSNLIVAYYAYGGLSANRVLADREDNMIYDELSLPYSSKIVAANRAKEHLLIYRAAKLLLPRKIMDYINEHFRWQKHHCNNKICRWCGRYEE